jgi:hypothetical protein
MQSRLASVHGMVNHVLKPIKFWMIGFGTSDGADVWLVDQELTGLGQVSVTGTPFTPWSLAVQVPVLIIMELLFASSSVNSMKG